MRQSKIFGANLFFHCTCNLCQSEFSVGNVILILVMHLQTFFSDERNKTGKASYLWRILGQWDILLLNLTSIGFTIFLLIFDLSFFTNADVVTIKSNEN